MKPTSPLLGILFISTVTIFLPQFAMATNEQFGLPQYDSPAAQLAGIAAILVGGIIDLYCAGVFVTSGKGTPVPTDPPKRFVNKGLYRYTRNPMYLGLFLIILGEFFLFGHLALLFYLLLTITIFHVMVVYVEEPQLEKRFGKEYRKYKSRVPRWL